MYVYTYVLYTGLPNAEGIKAVRKSLDNHPKRTVATKVITTFLALILTLNNFILTLETICKQKAVLWEPSEHHHTQIYFMDHFLKKLIYPFIKGFSLIYLRFIDDIFFIWTGNKKDRHKTRIH